MSQFLSRTVEMTLVEVLRTLNVLADTNDDGACSPSEALLPHALELFIDEDRVEGNRVLLVDLLTHEVGHYSGLSHNETDQGCAMCGHSYCEPVVPSPGEIEAAMEVAR